MLAKEYGALMMKNKNEYNQEQGENILSEREKHKQVEWVDVVKMPTEKLNDEDNLLLYALHCITAEKIGIQIFKISQGENSSVY